jgi:ATP-binding cassette subfamily B protein
MIPKHIENTHTLQLDESDCGVACLLSIIKFYQGNHSIEKLREFSGTTQQGTTLLGLYQVANSLGFNTEGCEADIPSLIEHNQPVILHVVIDKQLQHYVVGKRGWATGKWHHDLQCQSQFHLLWRP